MADSVTSQKITDGLRNAVYKFTNISDGTGESAVTKVDVSALAADTQGTQGRACSSVNVERIVFSTKGMSVRILEDATSDVLICELPADVTEELSFFDFGGIPNSKAAGFSGDINFTTFGAASGDAYTVVMQLKKNY